MKRPLFLLCLALALLLAGLAAVNATIVVLAVPPLCYLALAATRAPHSPRLRAERQVSATSLSEGDVTNVTLKLVNEGHELGELVVEERPPYPLTISGGYSRAMAALRPGATLAFSYSLQGKRGAFDLPPVQVTVSDGLGLFRQSLSLPGDTRLLVVPTFQRLRSIAIRPRQTLGFTGPIPARQSGAGIDFFGVRSYQPGDPLRHINWRATARYQDLHFTNEFEQERIANIGLILDVRPQMALLMGGESLLEKSTQATAALADSLLRDGHRVGLLLYGHGQEWLVPGYGRVQRERILRLLAQARAGEHDTFQSLNYLPTRLFPARSQLLFVSPLAADDGVMLFRLRAWGYAVMVVTPDVVSFEVERLPAQPLLSLAARLARLERRLLLQQLRQGGVVVVNWPPGQSLDEALYMTLRRHGVGPSWRGAG